MNYNELNVLLSMKAATLKCNFATANMGIQSWTLMLTLAFLWVCEKPMLALKGKIQYSITIFHVYRAETAFESSQLAIL